MQHRHLNHQRLTLAVIARGRRADWEQLRADLLQSPALAEKIRYLCRPRIVDPYAQRYHFWMHYVDFRFGDAVRGSGSLDAHHDQSR
jgi:hypothetical protein